eukprot:gene2752-biopygen2687
MPRRVVFASIASGGKAGGINASGGNVGGTAWRHGGKAGGINASGGKAWRHGGKDASWRQRQLCAARARAPSGVLALVARATRRSRGQGPMRGRVQGRGRERTGISEWGAAVPATPRRAGASPRLVVCGVVARPGNPRIAHGSSAALFAWGQKRAEGGHGWRGRGWQQLPRVGRGGREFRRRRRAAARGELHAPGAAARNHACCAERRDGHLGWQHNRHAGAAPLVCGHDPAAAARLGIDDRQRAARRCPPPGSHRDGGDGGEREDTTADVVRSPAFGGAEVERGLADGAPDGSGEAACATHAPPRHACGEAAGCAGAAGTRAPGPRGGGVSPSSLYRSSGREADVRSPGAVDTCRVSPCTFLLPTRAPRIPVLEEGHQPFSDGSGDRAGAAFARAVLGVAEQETVACGDERQVQEEQGRGSGGVQPPVQKKHLYIIGSFPAFFCVPGAQQAAGQPRLLYGLVALPVEAAAQQQLEQHRKCAPEHCRGREVAASRAGNTAERHPWGSILRRGWDSLRGVDAMDSDSLYVVVRSSCGPQGTEGPGLASVRQPLRNGEGVSAAVARRGPAPGRRDGCHDQMQAVPFRSHLASWLRSHPDDPRIRAEHVIQMPFRSHSDPISAH